MYADFILQQDSAGFLIPLFVIIVKGNLSVYLFNCLLLFLLQDSLYGFPILFTVTSEHIRLFTF